MTFLHVKNYVKSRLFSMKKVLLSLIMMAAISVNAQIYSDGTVIQGFSATDINNNFFSSTIANNDGKHIIIDFSATWCTSCWAYHNSKVLDRYNDKFGPNGTDAQDAEVMLYEADAATNSNDLNGIGTSTVGDWVLGTNYQIFNEANVTNVRSSFSNGGQMGFPTVFLVCADKKMYRLSVGMTDENLLRDFVNTKCGLTPLSTNTIHALDFSYEIFPNPVSNNLKLNLNLDKSAEVKYSLIGLQGQVVQELENTKLNAGAHNMSIDVSYAAAGLYMLNMQVGEEFISEKVMIQK